MVLFEISKDYDLLELAHPVVTIRHPGKPFAPVGTDTAFSNPAVATLRLSSCPSVMISRSNLSLHCFMPNRIGRQSFFTPLFIFVFRLVKICLPVFNKSQLSCFIVKWEARIFCCFSKVVISYRSATAALIPRDSR